MQQQQLLQRTDQNMLMRNQFGNSMGMQPNGINMAKQAMVNNRNK
jgi:hypothetical protein